MNLHKNMISRNKLSRSAEWAKTVWKTIPNAALSPRVKSARGHKLHRVMKAAVLGAVLLGATAGCGTEGKRLTVKEPASTSNPAVPQPQTGDSTAQTGKPQAGTASASGDLWQQFQAVAAQAKEPRDITAFLDREIKTADAKTAGNMVRGLEQFDEQHLTAIQANFKQLLTDPKIAQKLYDLQDRLDFDRIQGDETFKHYLLRLQEGKLALDSREGDFFWKIDYPALERAYGTYVSGDMKSYLSIRTAESKRPVLGDNAVKISRDQLADRILTLEGFLTQYKDSPNRAIVRQIYGDYVKVYLTHYRYDAIDEKTGKLIPAVKQSYEKFAGKYPDAKTTAIVKAYVELIRANKDVIYEKGKPGESELGDPKPNIAKFWNEDLDKRINEAFPH